MVIPVLRGTAARGCGSIDRQAQGGAVLGLFDGCVPVPMQTPGAPYVDTSSSNDGSSSLSFGGLGKVLLRPWCLG